MIAIIETPIDATTIIESVRSNRAGAVCLFLGTVRELTADRQTHHLEYEAYSEMAITVLNNLEREARRRWPVIELTIVHRVGLLAPADISVAIAVSCPHRAAAFEATQWLIDSLKEVVPIWKKEVWTDGDEEWVHPGRPGPEA